MHAQSQLDPRHDLHRHMLRPSACCKQASGLFVSEHVVRQGRAGGRTSPVSVLPRWRFISASMSALSASPSTSPMQLRSLARLDQVLPCSSLNTCAHVANILKLPSVQSKPRPDGVPPEEVFRKLLKGSLIAQRLG